MKDYKTMTNEQLRDIALGGTDYDAYLLYCFKMGELHGIGSPFKTFQQWLEE